MSQAGLQGICRNSSGFLRKPRRSPRNGTGTSPTRCWRRPGRGELEGAHGSGCGRPCSRETEIISEMHIVASCQDDSNHPERGRGQAKIQAWWSSFTQHTFLKHLPDAHFALLSRVLKAFPELLSTDNLELTNCS